MELKTIIDFWRTCLRVGAWLNCHYSCEKYENVLTVVVPFSITHVAGCMWAGQIKMYKYKLGDRRQIFIHLTLHAKAESCNSAMKQVHARMHTWAHFPGALLVYPINPAHSRQSHGYLDIFIDIFFTSNLLSYSTYLASSLPHYQY